jgi:hypothetical protein
VTVVRAEAVLLAEVGSGSAAETAAELERTPDAAVTVTVMVTFEVDPEARGPG